MTVLEERLALAQHIADEFSAFPEVEAIVLGGSAATGRADTQSDIDVYVYVNQEIPVARRHAFIAPRAAHIEMDNRMAETVDFWVESASGIAVDLMYRDPRWIEGQLDDVLVRHYASQGYSTAFWHNIRSSKILFDRNGWFARLQARANAPYPPELAAAIIAKNHPSLRESIFSWQAQLLQAVRREDAIAANQKVGRLLAIYFDVLFALNHVVHPGEKRLLGIAAQCEKCPPLLAEQVHGLLAAVCHLDLALVEEHTTALLDGLDALLQSDEIAL